MSKSITLPAAPVQVQDSQDQDLADEAVRQGVTKRTAERWTISWIEKGLIMKTSYGEYKKIA